MYKINEKRLIKIFTDLAKISSPSWEETEVIAYLTDLLKELPVTIKKYRCRESYNLLIKKKGTVKGKPALLSAHMDTVTPCENIKPIVTDSRITSDGTTILGSDDKSAIAIFMEALFQLHENKIDHGPIEILLTCAEEVGLYGAKCFDMSLLESKKAFVFDCDGKIGRIILKAPYHSTMNIGIKGKAAHAGIEPEKGINAITALSEIITGLPCGRLDEETTANIGTISGGRATNIVAEYAQCELEVRSINREKMIKHETAIRERVKKISAKHGVKPKISRNLEYSGFTIKKEDAIVKIVSEALSSIKIKPSYEISGGGSDTNIFNRAGIKAVNMSCGMQKVHTNNEYILIKDLVNGTKLVMSILERMK